MNNLEKLNILIKKGEKISETKTRTKKHTNICIINHNTLMDWGNELWDCNTVNEALYQEWFKDVEEFITKIKLKNFKETYYIDEISGNFLCFDKQLKNLKTHTNSLYL